MAENENAIVNTEATLSESKLVAPGTGNKLSPNPHNFGFTKQVKTDTLPMSGEFNTIYIVPNGNEFLFWKWNEQHEWERVVNDSIPSLQAKKGNNVANTKVVTPQKTAFEKVFQGDVGINGDLYYQGKKLSIKDVDGKVTVDEIDSESQVAGKIIVSDGLGGAVWGDVGGLEIIDHAGTDTIPNCANNNVPYILHIDSAGRNRYFLCRFQMGLIWDFEIEEIAISPKRRWAGSSNVDATNLTLNDITGTFSENSPNYKPYVEFRNLAPAYNSATTYDIGDIVSLGGSIYRCNTPITTAENFNPSNWTQIAISEIPGIPVYSLADITKPNNSGYYTLEEVYNWCNKDVFVYDDYLVERIWTIQYDSLQAEMTLVFAYKVTTSLATVVFEKSATKNDIEDLFASDYVLNIISIDGLNPFAPEEYLAYSGSNTGGAGGYAGGIFTTMLEAGTESGTLVTFDNSLGAVIMVALTLYVALAACSGYTGDYLFHTNNTAATFNEIMILQGCTVEGDRIGTALVADFRKVMLGQTPNGAKADASFTLESNATQYTIALHYDTETDTSNPGISLTFYKHNKTTANSVNYLTTEPSANNTDGDIKVVVLSSEPATRYDGYLYIITE